MFREPKAGKRATTTMALNISGLRASVALTFDIESSWRRAFFQDREGLF